MATPTPKRIGTLSDLITERRSLVLYCMTMGCKAGGREVDITAVIEARGDMPVQKFADRSGC